MNLPSPTIEEQTPYTDLTGRVSKIEDHYFAYGGFSEIYKGILTRPDTQDVRNVAIKILRGVHTDEETLLKTIRRLNRESRVWHALHHENVLEFLGISYDLAPSPALVSPLCKEGQIIQYIRNNPEADKPRLILQVAKGLEYLHSKDVIHGDLKCSNVLVDDKGTALLCDFGRSKILESTGFTTIFAGATRYLAPELLGGESDEDEELIAFMPVLTKETDVYGFGMIGLEVITGEMPFHSVKNEIVLISKVRKGIPSRLPYPPEYENTWRVIERCWAKDPRSRPKMSAVVQYLPFGRR